MPLGTANTHITQSHASQSHAGFIPELWSDDVIAAYKANLVMGQLVATIPFVGKKGDSVHIPKPTRGAANAKVAETQVTLNRPAISEVIINVDKHYEYSFLIEDLAAVQALPSMRQFYTDDAGYALSKQVDTDLINLGAGFQAGSAYSTAVIGGDGSTTWNPSASTNTGNGSTLTDPGLRKMIQTLDDVETPFSGRRIVIPPVEKKTLTGIARFTEQAFVGEVAGANTIRNGLIGELYGIPVYVSTNCASLLATDASTPYRVGLMFHKDAIALAMQMNIRSQTQYKQEYLADLFTADTIYGVGELRDTGGIAFVVPA